MFIVNHILTGFKPLLLIVCLIYSCDFSNKSIEEKLIKDTLGFTKVALTDTIIISTLHSPNYITGDLDGDKLLDSVIITQNIKNSKYGLKLIFGNGEKVLFGMGQKVLGQDFDDMKWIGVFEIAPKSEVYWNYVNVEGEFIVDEYEISKVPKIKLPNDGIFVHEAESCGGGVIYLNKGKYEWIQQE